MNVKMENNESLPIVNELENLYLRSKTALGDARWACNKLKQIDGSDVDDRELRVLWVAGITLLRTAFHVLGNQETLNEVKNITRPFFDKWRQDPIFEGFIDVERNTTVKEYQLLIGGNWVETMDGRNITNSNNEALVSLEDHSSKIERLSKAIEWGTVKFPRSHQ